MTFKVIAPFVDVMGLPHYVGETLDVSKYGMKRYEGFIAESDKKEVKKNGKRRKSSASAEVKSSADNECL